VGLHPAGGLAPDWRVTPSRYEFFMDFL